MPKAAVNVTINPVSIHLEKRLSPFLLYTTEGALREFTMLTLYLNLINDEDERRKFEKIYYTYRKQMLYLARSIVKEPADAEDVVHDVFMNIASKHMDILGRIQSDTDLRNYLLKATKNTALNLIKRHKKQAVPIDTVAEADNNIVLTDESFLEKIYLKIEYENLVNAIKNLDEKYRDVLYYHFIMELSVPDVAKLLQKKTPTIKKQLVRGKAALLKLLNIGEDLYADE